MSYRRGSLRALVESLEGRQLFSTLHGLALVDTTGGYYGPQAAFPDSEPGTFRTHVVAGATAASFSVYFFTSDRTLDHDSVIGNNNVFRITGPGGYEGFAEAPTAVDAGGSTFTYTFAAPGGRWDAADSGWYAVTQLPDQVRDTGGTSIWYEPLLGRFNVNLPAVAPDVRTTFDTSLPQDAPAGTRGEAILTVLNAGNGPVASRMSVRLELSDGPNPDRPGATLATRDLRLRLAPGQSKPVRLRFVVPSHLVEGTYQLSAGASLEGAHELDETNNAAPGSKAIHVIPNTIETAVSIVRRPDSFARGEVQEMTVRIDNATASGANTRVSGEVFVYSNALRRSFSKKFTAEVPVGTSRELTLKIKPPASLPPGTYKLQVTVSGMPGTLQLDRENDAVLAQVEIL